MKILRYLFFLPLMVLLTACPYESKVPITEPVDNLDKRLIGKWVKADDREKEYPSEYYEIKAMSDQFYDVMKYELNSQDSTYRQDGYVAHLSEVGSTFLNMKKSGKYYLHRVDIDEDQFTLFEVTDNIDESFESSEELLEFVRQHQGLSFFYNKDEKTYFRQVD